MKRFILVAVVGALLLCVWARMMLAPVNPSSAAPIILTIAKGDSVADIATKLEEYGLIRSGFVFKLYARVKGAHTNLQAGTFSLNQSMSVDDVLITLRTGKSGEISITIPEGWTVAAIDAFMASKGLGKPGDILDCAYSCDFSDSDFLPKNNFATRADGYGSKLEGYLFPETYFVAVDGYAPEAFLHRMLETFRLRVIDGHVTDIGRSGRTLHDAVTMASLVEEESRHEEERPIVAGILWKREEAGTVLGVDATVRYLVGKPTGAITVSDLASDSPYNTRKVAGLPPGPIASPGISAILAALQPEASEYWYYLHGNDGVIHYARTNDEHNVNRARYLR